MSALTPYQKSELAKKRRRRHPAKYKKIGAWIRGIRKALDMTQRKFAWRLDISILTVRRWERAHGYMPSHTNYLQLQKLDAYAKSVKREKRAA